jgi:hypothetical protein
MKLNIGLLFAVFTILLIVQHRRSNSAYVLFMAGLMGGSAITNIVAYFL